MVRFSLLIFLEKIMKTLLFNDPVSDSHDIQRFFYSFPEHGSPTANKTFIRRDNDVLGEQTKQTVK